MGSWAGPRWRVFRNYFCLMINILAWCQDVVSGVLGGHHQPPSHRILYVFIYVKLVSKKIATSRQSSAGLLSPNFMPVITNQTFSFSTDHETSATFSEPWDQFRNSPDIADTARNQEVRLRGLDWEGEREREVVLTMLSVVSVWSSNSSSDWK